jgi:hypothetical protein
MNKFFFVFECENDLLKGRELHGERKYIIWRRKNFHLIAC